MGISTTYEESPGLHRSKKTCQSGILPCKGKSTLLKRPQHRLPLIKRRPRIVRFDIEANQVKEMDRILSDSKAALFWTRDERDDILESNQRLAREFRQQQPVSVQKANQVFDRCCQDAVTEDSSDEEDTEDSFQKDENDELEVQDILASTGNQSLEVPTHLRGLEWGFLPASKKYRRTHVQRVLRWQRCLDGGKDKSGILSARAMRSSRPSRVMARILAASDAACDKDISTARRTRCRMLPSWW